MTLALRRRVAQRRNAVFAVFALNGLGMASWIGRTPGIRASLGIDTGGMGLLILCLSAGSIVGLLSSSPMLHRVGGRRAVAGAAAACAVGLLIIGAGVDVWHAPLLVAFGMAVYGFGTGLCDVGMNVEGAEVERRAGRTLLPLFHAV